ncbi:hypothetical protein RUM43_014616 [Polyplax serrata]|uniref:Uncharacterized protein n=1 Tax=Polyplax serrata TaxID=468196 RepID=A0AAN8PIA9_POLSC
MSIYIIVLVSDLLDSAYRGITAIPLLNRGKYPLQVSCYISSRDPKLYDPTNVPLRSSRFLNQTIYKVNDDNIKPSHSRPLSVSSS